MTRIYESDEVVRKADLMLNDEVTITLGQGRAYVVAPGFARQVHAGARVRVAIELLEDESMTATNQESHP